MRKPFFIPIIVVVACLGLAGCDTTKSKSKEIARVAKDWSLVIRGSQVIPVYPLTEDLLPGDVFLVQSRIEDQVRLYEKRGFLPLDQLLVRLQPTNYSHFYLGAYGIDGHTNTPYHWKTAQSSEETHDWGEAPRAAFPSYSFTVERGAGLNLALPVQCVPLALNMMGTANAHGTITIDDAFTYGIDTLSMREQVESWSRGHSVHLAELAPTENRTNHLRVVNRVYLARQVNVSIFNDEASAVGGSAGVGRPVSILNLIPTDSAANFKGVLDSISANVESAALPGGALKLVAASSRSVSLVESFPRPLVIGYLGFDLPILADGRLGPSVPTQARLNRLRINPPRVTVFGDDQNSTKIDRWLKSDAENRDRLRTWLDEQGYTDHGVTNIIWGNDYADLRVNIVSHFRIN